MSVEIDMKKGAIDTLSGGPTAETDWHKIGNKVTSLT